MRIVLAEDEKKTRNGILHMIQQYTAHKVVGVAENGEEGYEIVRREKPDLLISDIKMPVLDGLEMLEKLHKEKLQVNTILLTGYSDFEYARRALKFQVLDYLLKPLDAEEFLKNLDAVEARISNIRSSHVSVEQLLANYLANKGEKATDEQLLSERLHVNEKTEITLFLISPRKIFAEHIKEYGRCLEELMRSLCIENAHVFQIPGEKQIMALIVGTEKNRSLKNRFAMRILPELEEIGGCTCVYQRIYGIRSLVDAVACMNEMRSFAFSLPEHTIVDRESVESVKYSELAYPQSLENVIIREMRSGHREKIDVFGKSFIEEIINSEAEPDVMKEYAIRLIANVLHIAKEMKEYFAQEENIKYFVEAVISSETRGEMRYQLEKFFHTIVREQKQELEVENGHVMNAISYIREHYSEEIALSDLARICRVTPEYLSKIFYNETGINFSHFLQNFRISIAKRMLLTENCKVYEVAEAVGFHDQKYFVKIFKKLCGVTPSEYRREYKP